MPGGYYPSDGGRDEDPPGEQDSAWSIEYLYDDEFTTDPTSITQRIRVDKELPSQKNRMWIDDLSRVVRQDVFNADDSYDSTITSYDYNGRISSVEDQLGFVTTSQYDHLDRPVNTVHPDPARSADSIHYSVTNAAAIGLDTMFTFNEDLLYRKETIDENSNSVIEYHDVRGNLRLRQTFAGSYVLSTYFDYDDLGNLSLVIKPNGDSVRYFYNSLGQLMEMQSADLGKDLQNPRYGSTYFEYDKNGNVIATSESNFNFNRLPSLYSWRYARYDELNRTIEEGLKQPSGLPGEYSYTPYTRYFYDQSNCELSLGRLSLSFQSDPHAISNYAERFDYDGRGRVIRKTCYFNAQLDSAAVPGTGRWEYNVTGDSLVLEYTYDWADQLRSITYPDGSVVSYRYDNRGRLTAVGGEPVQDSIKYVQAGYTRRDRLEQMVLGQGLQIVDYQYNERGWLESINDGVSSDLGAPNDVFGQQIYYYESPFGSIFTPQYNGNLYGQTVSIDGTSFAAEYDYDETDRLITSVQRLPSFFITEVNDYDKNGNVVHHYQVNPASGQITDKNFEYEQGTNRLIRVDTGEFETDDTLYYDPSGNLAWQSGKKAAFSYDIYNRLSTIYVHTDLGTDSIWFGYNAAGDRIYKKYFYHYRKRCHLEFSGPVGGGAIEGMGDGFGGGPGPGDSTSIWCTFTDTRYTYYVRGNGKVLAELSSVSPVSYKAQFIYSGGSRIAMRNNAGMLHYYLNDHLGSARVVLDSTGVIKDKHRYFAFGETYWEETNTNQSYRYTGKPLDSESGLDIYYYGARYYDPSLQRFLGIDPLEGKYPNWSPYVYTADNPLKYVDPDGRFLDTFVDVVSVVVSAVDFVKDPSWENAGWLALDVGAAVVPFVPAAGLVRHGSKLVKAADAIGLTGDAAKTADKLTTIANKAEDVVGGSGHVAGSKKHTVFAEGVDDLKHPGLKSEQSFKDGGQVRRNSKGSTRIDAVQYDDSEKPIAAFDLKTGNAKLTSRRIQQFRDATRNPNLKVFEIRPDEPESRR